MDNYIVCKYTAASDPSETETQSMKTALLVIDMQNDYLWEKRIPIFAYDTERLVAAVNELIHEYGFSFSF